VIYVLGVYMYIDREPVFLITPQDTVVAQNSDVLLQCQVSGTPQPVVLWKKVDGQIPAERFCACASLFDMISLPCSASELTVILSC